MGTWPGLSPRTQQVFELTGRGVNAVQFFNGYVVRRARFYHRINLPVNTVPAAQNFFSTVAGPAAGVTNWPNAVGLPTETAFWLRCLRFDFDVSQTLAGAAGAPVINYEAGAVTVATNVAQINHAAFQLFNQGNVQAKVGARLFVDNEFGLKAYPAGGGLSAGGYAAATLTAQASLSNQMLQNGEPNASNGDDRGWIPVLPNKPVNVGVTWNAGTPATPNNVYTINLSCIMDGIIVYPQSL